MTSDCDCQLRLHLCPPPCLCSLMNGHPPDASPPPAARVRSASPGRWRKPSPTAAQRPRPATRVCVTPLTFTRSPTLRQFLVERGCYGNSNHGDISTIHPALLHTTRLPPVHFREYPPSRRVIGGAVGGAKVTDMPPPPSPSLHPLSL